MEEYISLSFLLIERERDWKKIGGGEYERIREII